MSKTEEFLGPITLTLNTLWLLQPNYPDLIFSLQKRGYHPSRVPGVIAEKDDFRISANLSRRVLGVDGNSSVAVMMGFKEIMEVLEKELKVDLKSSIMFYELLGGVRVSPGHNPLEKLNNFFGRNKIFDEFESIFNEEVAPFSIRLASKGRRPDSIEWFDITIEPVLTSSTSRYYIRIVYRSQNKDKVLSFLHEFENKIIKVINIVGS